MMLGCESLEQNKTWWTFFDCHSLINYPNSVYRLQAYINTYLNIINNPNY